MNALRIVVLAGGGHAHLEVIRRAEAFKRVGARLVLVDPGDFHYSGGASAVLGGSLPESGNRIDLGRLAARHGVERIAGRAVGLDRTSRHLRLDHGGTLPFDLVSFNVGSRVGAVEPAGSAYAAKPIADLERLRRDLSTGREGERIVVVGGGATGVEMAGNLMRLGRETGRRLDIALIVGGERLLGGMPQRAGRIAAASLRRAGLRLVFDARLVSVGKGGALLTSGAWLPFHRIVHATGLVADPLMGRLGLPTGPDGGLLVEATLASAADASVFAVGDCASLAGITLPKSGVHGVRAAPVLAHNLLAALAGTPPCRFRPQRTWLSILDLGDGTGLATRGPFVLHAEAALRWKRRIDQRFLQRYG